MAVSTSKELKFIGLPLDVAQPVDIGRLIREVEKLDEQLRQAALRASGSKPDLPKLSDHLTQLVSLNAVDIGLPNHRQQLLNFLNAVKTRASVIHISFSTEPSTDFIKKLMTYLRREINPLLLLTVGLEPNIGAGCLVRTNNKFFDFSLSERLKADHGLLVQKIQEVTTSGKPS